MPGSQDSAIRSAQVAVYRAGKAGAFGGAVLVAPGLVLTCAHVVSQVFGRESFAAEPPVFPGEDLVGLEVAFPGVDGVRRAARLRAWAPPLRGGGHFWAGDLALLELVEPPPAEVRPVPLARHRLGEDAWAWYGSGQSGTVARLAVQEAGAWITVDAVGSAQRLTPGYSGSPMWDRGQQAVVGLVVSVQDGSARGFAVPAGAVVAAFPEVFPRLAERSEPVDPREAARWQLLAEAVQPALRSVDARLHVAQMLADELKLEAVFDAEPPGVDWLVQAALRTAHGVPTLLSLAAGQLSGPDERRLLLAAGPRAAPGDLLTAREFRTLRKLLSTLAELSPRRIAADALPHVAPLDQPAGDWPSAVRSLERFHPRPGEVPHLLRVMEFAAARLADPALRDDLRDWTATVARRLGTEAGWLAVRPYAEAAARPGDAAAEQVVVQVELWPSADDTYRFTIRIREGGGRITPVTTQDSPQSRAALLSHLREALIAAARPACSAMPSVEFFMERDWLDLDVDQWDSSVDGLRSVLGVDHELVLRCPKGRSPVFEPQWRQRWDRLVEGRVLQLECVDDRVRQHDVEDTVSCVVLSGPPEEQRQIRAAALVVGIPVIFWHRRDHSTQTAVALDRLVHDNGVVSLPAAVQRQRAKALHSKQHLGEHLALLWDGPEPAPVPVLAIPSFEKSSS